MEHSDFELNIQQSEPLTTRVFNTGLPAILICGLGILFASIFLADSRLILVVTLLVAALLNWLYSSYRMNQYHISSLIFRDGMMFYAGVDGTRQITGEYSLAEIRFSILASNNFLGDYILEVRSRRDAKLIFRQYEKNGWTKDHLVRVIESVKRRMPASVERQSLTIL